MVKNGQILIIIFNCFELVAKILKIWLKIEWEKGIVKSSVGQIFYFPHPFMGKQHQNLFTSEIITVCSIWPYDNPGESSRSY